MRFQPGCLPPPLQPLSLLSKPTPVSVSEALQRWKGICNAPPLTELCSVIRGKFTGLVWILNTLLTPVQPAVEKTETLVVSVRCLVRPENINALMRLISFTVFLYSKQEEILLVTLGNTQEWPAEGSKDRKNHSAALSLHLGYVGTLQWGYSRPN